MITQSQDQACVKPVSTLCLLHRAFSISPDHLEKSVSALKEPKLALLLCTMSMMRWLTWHLVTCTLRRSVILDVLYDQPPGFVDNRYPHHVCLLQRSLYGLKQAPRAWFQRFAGCILYYYGGDILLTVLCPSLTSADWRSHKKYALQLLERAHMVTCNPSRTPVDTESKLELEVSARAFIYMRPQHYLSGCYTALLRLGGCVASSTRSGVYLRLLGFLGDLNYLSGPRLHDNRHSFSAVRSDLPAVVAKSPFLLAQKKLQALRNLLLSNRFQTVTLYALVDLSPDTSSLYRQSCDCVRRKYVLGMDDKKDIVQVFDAQSKSWQAVVQDIILEFVNIDYLQ
ncbi:ribonuclease H-like domain-containing protein [Tanacetum coccineum]